MSKASATNEVELFYGESGAVHASAWAERSQNMIMKGKPQPKPSENKENFC